MFPVSPTRSNGSDSTLSQDEYLFGWDSTPGIVSVWASRDGHALVWRREGARVRYTRERFRPWLFATSLADLAHLGSALLPANAPRADTAAFSYYKFDGQEESYAYLITARDGRELERMIVAGASRRLGRKISSLNDLENTYYRVGPVEQYLMLTGRVYFRDMVYNDLHRLQLDLETTALDPHRGRIFMVAICDNRGLSTTLEAPTAEDEARLITDLCALIRERNPDVIENHNLFGFDLPFLEQRAALLKLPLLMGREGGSMVLERREETLAIGPEARPRTRYSIAGRELIDTLDAVRRHDFVVRDMPSYRLKDVARYFGIATAERVYLEGAAIFETYRQNPELVRRYALDDVAEVDGLSRRLLGAPFALASMAPRRYERLASAGPAMGILEPILVRAYLRAGAALPCQAAQQTTENGLHEGGAVHLFAEGVAEHVVKADVASLYPSLMRTFQIGPACDRLGVLLTILGQLTDLRLAHKAAARTAPRGSVEANAHEATQAAMKILVNAAYGYMGAGAMALFADSRAAGEVTRQGREILNQVLKSLQEAGMALIEADTDGVYFAVPGNWTEEQERALVDETGASLPAGIRLEYEGRYKAMLSHEVKNYALLTYSGQLIVRGVALRSSRAEPFGVRFLRQALLCIMTNDIVGLRDAFLATVAAIRNRSLPAADMATRVRLSKTPEAYQASRAAHPEPAYEALLAAGRTRWFPGERVRFYRRQNKSYVWLPDEGEEVSADSDWEQEEEIDGTIQEKQIPASPQRTPFDHRDYDIEHYLRVLVTSYAARLRKAFAAEDFEQLFRVDGQSGLFDQPVEDIHPRWIGR
ncbi:MAG TPA: DNA polymerase domain-containing protein [Ktedonobacteraceae bacterium]|nr:DNA polymerase domain-containing protein [Ktedonobacteraceae bacterium]